MARKPAPVAALPTDEGERKQLFDGMLARSRWELAFSQDADHSVPMAKRFQERIRPVSSSAPIQATLELHFKGEREERQFFRQELAKRVKQRATEFTVGQTSINTVTDAKDIEALLTHGAAIAADKAGMAVSTYVPPSLCERVTIGYRGEQKGALGDWLASWLKSGELRLPSQVAALMIPRERDDKLLAENVEALQYFCKHGKNRPERYSPAL